MAVWRDKREYWKLAMIVVVVNAGTAAGEGRSGGEVAIKNIIGKELSDKYRDKEVVKAAEAVFVFGDSLVDVGNNNYLPLGTAKAAYLPNGIDFPLSNAKQPTGRFTNGLTIADIIAFKAGIPDFVPPYLAPTSHGQAILHGVNYASGGGGILNETGRVFIQRLSLDKQIEYFESTKEELNELLGSKEATEKLVANAIFSVTMGANDFINNYVSPIRDTTDIFMAPDDFYAKLITKYRTQLTRLYDDGARKFVIGNVPLIGCIPYQRSLQFGKGGQCNERANRVASGFNVVLKSLVDELNANLPGATFLYSDSFGIQVHILNNYKQYGFEYVDRPCCGALGSNQGLINCKKYVNACTDRSKYFFWDPYHPSQAGCDVIAQEFFNGTDFVSPMNVRQLLQL